jgi:hypothetical protein
MSPQFFKSLGRFNEYFFSSPLEGKLFLISYESIGSKQSLSSFENFPPVRSLKIPPQMPCDAFHLNLRFLGGCHIIAFGVPGFLWNQDRPATIRDSSLSFSVGSKNMASSPTSQGKTDSTLFDCRINHFDQST